jgi:hypothetical protein
VSNTACETHLGAAECPPVLDHAFRLLEGGRALSGAQDIRRCADCVHVIDFDFLREGQVDAELVLEKDDVGVEAVAPRARPLRLTGLR